MSCAVSACCLSPIWKTVVGKPYGVADLLRTLFLDGYRSYRPRRAHFPAFRAFRTAVSPFERHFRHHQPRQVGRRTQHLIFTHRHAELTSDAMVRKMGNPDRAGRDKRSETFRDLLVFDHRKPTVTPAFLSRQHCTADIEGRSLKEGPR